MNNKWRNTKLCNVNDIKCVCYSHTVIQYDACNTQRRIRYVSQEGNAKYNSMAMYWIDVDKCSHKTIET